MNSKQQLREQIAEILVKWSMPTRQAAISEILTLFEQAEAALLKAVGEKVIGKDEDERSYGNYSKDATTSRNQFRAEQRKALAKLQEGEK